jgi:hypothetical protein
MKIIFSKGEDFYRCWRYANARVPPMLLLSLFSLSYVIVDKGYGATALGPRVTHC